MTSSTLPVITRRTPGEDAAARAHSVLHAALAVADLWGTSVPAGAAARDLDEALDEHRSLTDGLTHWEQPYPELSVTEDPHGEALSKAAEEAEALARGLLVAIAATCGTEVADGIKAVAGEAS